MILIIGFIVTLGLGGVFYTQAPGGKVGGNVDKTVCERDFANPDRIECVSSTNTTKGR